MDKYNSKTEVELCDQNKMIWLKYSNEIKDKNNRSDKHFICIIYLHDGSAYW